MELIIKNCTIGLQWHSFNYIQCLMAVEFDPTSVRKLTLMMKHVQVR